jgi:hypothetical protein
MKSFLCALLFLGWSSLFASVATIESLEGQPYAIRKLRKVSLQVGSSLEERDNLYTKAGSLVIKMKDGSLVRLGKESHFKVKTYRAEKNNVDRKLVLFKGDIRLEVNKIGEGETFSIRTPTAVAGVRGTDFNVNYDPEASTPSTRVTVFSGLVACHSIQTGLGATTLVGAGYSSSIAKGKKPGRPEKVSRKVLNRIKKSTAGSSDSDKEESENDSSESESGQEEASSAQGGEESNEAGPLEVNDSGLSEPDPINLETIVESIQESTIETIVEQVTEVILPETHSTIFDEVTPTGPPSTFDLIQPGQTPEDQN